MNAATQESGVQELLPHSISRQAEPMHGGTWAPPHHQPLRQATVPFGPSPPEYGKDESLTTDFNTR